MAVQTDQSQFFTCLHHETGIEYYSSSQIHGKFHGVNKTPAPFVCSLLPIQTLFHYTSIQNMS